MSSIEGYKERIISTWRSWNNSMYHYEDYANVWNPDTKKKECVRLGTDFLDAVKVIPDIDKGQYAAEWAEYQENLTNLCRQNELQRLKAAFKHHGEQTAEKLAIWFQENNERMGIRKLEKLLQTVCRSKFKLSLQEQTIRWILNPAERKYGWPLSERQMDCV